MSNYLTPEEYQKYFGMLGKKKQPKGRKHEEDDLQKRCMKWFSIKYPYLTKLMFRIKNEGESWSKKSSTGKSYSLAGNKNKAMGTVSGVGDLCLAVNSGLNNALYIELKKLDGTQSDNQKYWQMVVTAAGNKYVVCDNINDFEKAVDEYVSNIQLSTLSAIKDAMDTVDDLVDEKVIKRVNKLINK